MRRLDEVSYSDLTPLGEVLKRHLGKSRFIHFSKQKDRFGINPKAHHGDPPGVYFYPVDWLWNHEDFHDHQQFGANWPYYIICEINFASRGLDLNDVSHDEIRALGEQNGWFSDYQQYEHWTQLRHGDGQKMWEFLKRRNQHASLAPVLRKEEEKGQRWLSSLKGIGWIKDTRGIIHSNEPEQLCAIDPRVIRLIESGEQPSIDQHEWEKWSYWQHAVRTLFERLKTNHGGSVVWRDKKPKWVVDGDNWSFSVEYNDKFAMSGLRMEWRTGRATESGRISAREMRDDTLDGVMGRIEKRLEEVKAFDGNDLNFQPIIGMEKAQELFDSFFVDPPTPSYEISNAHSIIWLDSTRTRGKPPVKTTLTVRVSDKDVNLGTNVEVNGVRVATTNGSPETFAEDFWKSLETYSKSVTKYHPDADHYKRLSPDLWEPYLGWLFIQTGLTVLQQYEDAFVNHRNLRELYGQFDRIFSRVTW